jgi:hypothetical protein
MNASTPAASMSSAPKICGSSGEPHIALAIRRQPVMRWPRISAVLVDGDANPLIEPVHVVVCADLHGASGIGAEHVTCRLYLHLGIPTAQRWRDPPASAVVADVLAEQARRIDRHRTVDEYRTVRMRFATPG